MKLALNGRLQPATGTEMVELPSAPGVFETLLIRGRETVFFDDHWERFAAGCRWHGFGPPALPEEVIRLTEILAAENRISTGVLRFAAWRAGEGVEWRVEVAPPRPHQSRGEFRLGSGAVLPAPTPDRPFKHLNRGPWLEALRAARAANADEAILCDTAGRLVEGCVSNLFFVRDGGLHTPSLEMGPLPGVMRRRVLELARRLRWPVSEGSFAVADLAGAAEIWLSNSLIGLRSAVGPQVLQADPARPALQRFRAAWKKNYGWDPVVVAPAG
ncbi:MAG TPA: aminotransferase class IV [Opitutaceae bacterium]|nr:aminotransferase class IV [Opitutaceae bacterium]